MLLELLGLSLECSARGSSFGVTGAGQVSSAHALFRRATTP